jgi:chloride channel 7
VLFYFFICYFSMAIVTYGLAVPSGLFVPALLSGAAMGRMIASLLHTADNYSGTFADAGTYALVGAVAVLGGVARMTISLTVIMLEATGDMQYVLPLMVTLLMSRWSGNAICEGIYDMHINLNNLPILENDPPETSRTHDLCAREIMSSNVVAVEPVMTVGALYDAVSTNTHACFPVRLPSFVRPLCIQMDLPAPYTEIGATLNTPRCCFLR